MGFVSAEKKKQQARYGRGITGKFLVAVDSLSSLCSETTETSSNTIKSSKQNATSSGNNKPKVDKSVCGINDNCFAKQPARKSVQKRRSTNLERIRSNNSVDTNIPSSSSTKVMPWDLIIPGTFFAASAVCWYDPKKAPSILFAFFALGAIFFKSIACYFKSSAVYGVSTIMTESITTITDENKNDQTDVLVASLADTVERTMLSTTLTTTLIESIVDSLNDNNIQDTAINTIQSAIMRASENPEFKSTMLTVTKQAIVEALNDKDFMDDFLSVVNDAIVNASQDEKLKRTLHDVTTSSISTALQDEVFMSEFRGAIKDVLRDGELYRAGATGFVKAALGGSSKANTKNKDSSKDKLNES